jgi:hypothetical protein
MLAAPPITIRATGNRCYVTESNLFHSLDFRGFLAAGAPEAEHLLAEWKEEHLSPKLKYQAINFGGYQGKFPVFLALGLVRGISDMPSKKGQKGQSKELHFRVPELLRAKKLSG